MLVISEICKAEQGTERQACSYRRYSAAMSFIGTTPSTYLDPQL